MDKPLSDNWFAQKRGCGLGGPQVGHLINNPFATLAKYILVFVCSRSHNWGCSQPHNSRFQLVSQDSNLGMSDLRTGFFYDTCCPWIPPSRKGAPKERLGPQEDQLSASHTHPGVPQVAWSPRGKEQGRGGKG